MWLNVYPRGVAFTVINVADRRQTADHDYYASVFTRVRTTFMWRAAQRGAESERRAGRHINNVRVYYARGR